MPSTRSGKGKPRKRKTSATNTSGSEDPVAMRNVNSNQRSEDNLSVEHTSQKKRLTLQEYAHRRKSSEAIGDPIEQPVDVEDKPRKGRNRSKSNNSQSDLSAVNTESEMEDILKVNPDDTELAEFEEQGELIQMAINDGGAEAASLASDGEPDPSDEDEVAETEESQDESESQLDHSGMDTVEEDDEEPLPEMSKGRVKSKVVKVRHDSGRKPSVEDHLDQMGSTLEAMKDFFLNQSATARGPIQRPTDRYEHAATEGRPITLSNSNITIYQNAVKRMTENDEISIDPEITFKEMSLQAEEIEQVKTKQRDSSSSENHIDTSDDMLEYDQNLNDRFIADCQAEAYATRGGPSTEDRKRERKYKNKQTRQYVELKMEKQNGLNHQVSIFWILT